MGLVPRLFPAETIVCLGGGPSLTAADVAWCQGRARVIAINDAVRLAPWADLLYGCDRTWWLAHPGTATFPGLKFGLQAVKDRADVIILENTGDRGLEGAPTGVRTGKNSGYQAINVAVHLGAARILLLGYDMQPDATGRDHFLGRRRSNPPYDLFRDHFPSMGPALTTLGVAVINCSRATALTCFPRQTLAQALPEAA